VALDQSHTSVFLALDKVRYAQSI